MIANTLKVSLSVAGLMLSLSGHAAGGFTLSSPEIKAGGTMPASFEFNGFGCKGDNQSPVLEWTSAPKGTESFALTVYDPDAPTGSGWWHWMVYNIPANVTRLEHNAGQEGGHLLPSGSVQAKNDYSKEAWGGTCPPPGDKPHHYIFTLYALKVERLMLPDDASTALAGYMINGNVIGKASFTATYGRK